MYTGGSNSGEFDPDKVDIFLIAYDMGSMHQCQFREKLIGQIWETYDSPNIKGLNEQLTVAARKANKSIQEIFSEEATKVLVKESDHEGKNLFATHIRNDLIL